MPTKKSNPKPLDNLVKELIEAIPPGVRNLPQELEKQFHQILNAALVKMDLITREEFDAQIRLLQRTREKLEMLDKKITARKPTKKK